MGKQKRKGIMIGAIFGIILSSAGVLGLVRGLDLKVERNNVTQKYDYHKIDLSNDESNVVVTNDNLQELFGIETEDKKNASILNAVQDFGSYLCPMHLDLGGLLLGSREAKNYQSLLYVSLKEHYDHFVVNAIPYYEEIYTDIDNYLGEPILDEDGNKVVQSLKCDDSILTITPLGNIQSYNGTPVKKQIKGNNGDINKPEITSFDYDLSGSLFQSISSFQINCDLSSVNQPDGDIGRVVILSIEVWNDTFKVEDTDLSVDSVE